MGLDTNKRQFIETQFLDNDGVWRLPLKSGMPYRFVPKQGADFNGAYSIMIESANHIGRLSSIGCFATHEKIKTNDKAGHLSLVLK